VKMKVNMNPRFRAGAGFLALLGMLLLGVGLSWGWIARTPPPSLDAARVKERIAAREETRAADQKALATAGVVDAQRGIYRIPIQDAMKLMREKWKNPAAGRADLMQRLGRAMAPPPEPVNIYDL